MNDTAPDFLLQTSNPSGSISKLFVAFDTRLQNSALRNFLIPSYIHRGRLSLLQRPDAIEPPNEKILNDLRLSLSSHLDAFVQQWQSKLTLISLPLLFGEKETASSVSLAQSVWPDVPAKNLVDESTYLPALSSLEREVFSESGARFEDFSSVFKQLPMYQRIRFYVDSIHLNEAGYSATAGRTATHLSDRFAALRQDATKKRSL